jgi:hypothetical protein
MISFTTTIAQRLQARDTATTIILRLVLAPIPSEPPKRASALRLCLRTPVPVRAEEREAKVNTMVREDACTELRVVRHADDVCRRACTICHSSG